MMRISMIGFISCDWMRANKSHLSDWLVGSVQIAAPAQRPDTWNPEGGYPPNIQQISVISFCLLNNTKSKTLYIGMKSMQHPDIWLGSGLVLPYYSAFSPGIRRADIRRTFSGYLSFPSCLLNNTKSKTLYIGRISSIRISG